MPYSSKAQQRKFHAMENKGEIAHETVKEFDEATNFDKIPERKKDKDDTSKSVEDLFDDMVLGDRRTLTGTERLPIAKSFSILDL